ncbi:MAG TPA: DUF4465 domain-containing protein [Flavipsychrobacter sp.]
MRKISTLAIALAFGATASTAQTVATFDTLSLTGTDTFYVNYSDPGNDVGFDDGLAHFECVYDTSWGGSWVSGFAYTNQTDVSDSSYNNLFTALPAKGYNNSANYVSVSAYSPVMIRLKGKAIGQPVKGFYATNLVYAYKEMTSQGFSKKFGGVPNTEPDWFKITIKGYLNGSMKTDSVDFYLADFRSPDSTKDYIVHSWEWVDLLPLGRVDSLELSLSSTDTAGGFGMNNPAYFAMDNFETYETSGIANRTIAYAAKVYPNPATDVLVVELNDKAIEYVLVSDAAGRLVARVPAEDKLTLNLSGYAPGVYILTMQGADGVATARFVKQ